MIGKICEAVAITLVLTGALTVIGDGLMEREKHGKTCGPFDVLIGCFFLVLAVTAAWSIVVRQ